MKLRPVVLVLSIAALVAAPPASAATFTVTDTSSSGAGSLRRAILDANANAGKDTIAFNIPGGGVQTIAPSPDLPGATDPVAINAKTQPGYSGTPLVQLQGSGANSTGLRIEGGDSAVRGLDVVGWEDGIVLQGGDGNVVAGNVIGALPGGRLPDPNYNGVAIHGSDDNRIGGTTPADRNIISGNDGFGVAVTNVFGGSAHLNLSQDRNDIVGNYIGTNSSGAAALENGFGILVEGAATRNVIGTAADGNVISGNKYDGVLVDGATSPQSQRPTATQIAGNMIGVDVLGATAVANGREGVLVSDADRTAIGGATLQAGNVISGNSRGGIQLVYALYTTVGGNEIGTGASGTTAVPNGFGVALNESMHTRIGRLTAGPNIYGAPNLISGNASDGVYIQDSSDNAVLENRIGTNGAGTAALPNGNHGVEIRAVDDSAQGNRIGAPDGGNVISGNGGDGVYIDGSRNRDQGGAGATQNSVVENSIGTNAAGNAPVANQNGIDTYRVNNNSFTNNLIAGNQQDGILVRNGVLNSILQNDIGKPGALANGADGVELLHSVSTTVRSNTVAGNLGTGVAVASGAGNTISVNSIYANGALGIDLGANGITPNDVGDPDSGANTLLNFPAITNAPISNGNVTISGSYDGAPSTTVRLEFFASMGCDPSGNGEGRTYLGARVVTTDSAGHGSYSGTFTLPYANPRITATAIDGTGNTSEFSPCLAAG